MANGRYSLGWCGQGGMPYLVCKLPFAQNLIKLSGGDMYKRLESLMAVFMVLLTAFLCVAICATLAFSDVTITSNYVGKNEQGIQDNYYILNCSTNGTTIPIVLNGYLIEMRIIQGAIPLSVNSVVELQSATELEPKFSGLGIVTSTTGVTAVHQPILDGNPCVRPLQSKKGGGYSIKVTGNSQAGANPTVVYTTVGKDAR
jgi:hypothetical protein